MGAESRLLYDERPLVLIPELARLLKTQPGFAGIDEALVLQQVHYWVIMNQRAQRNERGGYYWTYNTFKAWAEQFSFLWSTSTLKRIFARLEKRGLLFSGRFNKSNIDRTKWYRVNYEELDRLCQNEPSIVSSWPVPLGQVDPLHSVKLTPSGQEQTTNEKPLPEITHRVTTESNDREVSASSKPRRPPKLHSRPIFAKMQKTLGYPDKTNKDPIPNYGKEAKAIDRMLARGYSEEDIIKAWKTKVEARGVFVSMVWVNEDIGKPDRPKQAAFALPTEDELVVQAKEKGLVK
ncbi:hypothetical protein ES703_91788 [subsurface metagenome]